MPIVESVFENINPKDVPTRTAYYIGLGKTIVSIESVYGGGFIYNFG